MPLKLIVGKRDQIVMSNGCVITVKSVGARVTLEFDAPLSLKIHTIFDDPSKQFKNLRREAQNAAVSEIEGEAVAEGGQSLSPSQQRAMALQNLKRRD